MKFLVLILFFNVQILVAQDLVLISDIDDTLKRTHVLGNFSGGPFFENDFKGLNLLFGILVCRKNFPSMSQLMCRGQIDDNLMEGNGVYYVTASASFLNYWGKKFLEQSDFPSGEYYYKPNFGDSTYTYKFDTIEAILKEHESSGDMDVILLGDNGQKDPFIYEMISKRFQDSSLKIRSYIHMVYATSGEYDEIGVALKEGQIPYLTAVDLAIDFYNQEWIEATDVMLVYNEVMNYLLAPKNKDIEKIIPKWMRCHEYFLTDIFPKVKHPLLKIQMGLYQHRIKEICQNRSLED